MKTAGTRKNDIISGRVDVKGLEKAVRGFLNAAGVNLRDQHFKGTPSRVARAWKEEFLSGYGKEPGEVLGKGFVEDHHGLVSVRDVEFVSICPHHMLPYRGKAHVAYVPGGKVVGLSKIVRLVDCLSRRFTIQEGLTREISEALVNCIGARAAGCVIEAEHLCMSLRGVKQAGSRAVTSAYAGGDAKKIRMLEGAIKPRNIKAKVWRSVEGRLPALPAGRQAAGR